MPIDFSKLLDKKYLFNIYPDKLSLMWYLLGFFGALIIIAILIAIIYRPENYLKKEFSVKIQKMLWTCALVGFMLLFFRWQYLGILGKRFYLLIDFIILAAWSIYLIIYKTLILPKKLNFYQKQLEFKKYLPTREKNK
ncbi:MAG: Uncharacterized protein CEN89_435 [Candidatus Berkelbacteria bacterium Licking1014_7]|uniref:Uncharacterized protein n=1 Tax=Candidatus Berkelbacteria bacterium Licking1014_7 TaxID=2017147 RepID=A0A554LIU4_9BACT|nr:MAG: Uncharacterized protein CEN89_435 [Candidatus Berkelbacteria bacterium Licking1014_7]